MSPLGRPKGEYRSAKHEGAPLSAAGPVPRRSFPLGGTAPRRALGAT